MSKIFSVARVMARNNKHQGHTEDNLTIDASRFAVPAIVAVFSAALVFAAYKLSDIQTSLGAAKLDAYGLLSILFMIGFLLVLVLSFTDILSNLYMSTDLPALLVMPLTSLQLVASRLLVIMPKPLAFAFVSAIPFGVTYGIFQHEGLGYWLSILTAFITIPLLAVGIDGILIVLLMSVLRGLRNRDFLKYIGVIIVFAAYMLYMLDSDRLVSDGAVESAMSTAGRISILFPMNPFLRHAMSGDGLLWLLPVLGISALLAGIFGWLISKFYLKSALSMVDGSTKGRKVSAENLNRHSESNPLWKAVMTCDFKHMRRSPGYLMNAFLYPVAVPFVLLGMLCFRGDGIFSMFDDIGYLELSLYEAICFSIVSSTFSAGISCVAAKGISREGGCMDMYRQFPIDWAEYIKGKERLAFAINGIGGMGSFLVCGIIMSIRGSMHPLAIICGVIMSAIVIILMTDVMLMSDISAPNLDWENEVAVSTPSTKGAITAVAAMLAALVGQVAMISAEVSATMVAGGLITVLGIIAALAHRRLYRAGAEKLSRI